LAIAYLFEGLGNAEIKAILIASLCLFARSASAVCAKRGINSQSGARRAYVFEGKRAGRIGKAANLAAVFT
jgi:hypothetical protein